MYGIKRLESMGSTRSRARILTRVERDLLGTLDDRDDPSVPQQIVDAMVRICIG